MVVFDQGFLLSCECWWFNLADGAVYMVVELAAPDIAPQLAVSFLPLLVQLCELHHFPQADRLRSSVYKSLPLLAQRLGKTEFKRHMEPFLYPLFNSASSSHESHQSQENAVLCIHKLGQFVGRDIFAGRLPPDLRDDFEKLLPAVPP